jgi:hypothetical protein
MSAKAVVIDRSTLAVLYSHALLTDAEEIMGMLIGRKDVPKGLVDSFVFNSRFRHCLCRLGTAVDTK